jgi:hypothetical protein
LSIDWFRYQMRYPYEDLSPAQFEELIVLLCHKLLGQSVLPFATGKDGGRDARFSGTAEQIPSRAAPWVGAVIVQAKHTQGYNRSFSESNFFSADSSSSTIAKELPRIKKLRDDLELEHYMLFSNRSLTGLAESAIRNSISSECGLPSSSVLLCGVEKIELWLKSFPEVAQAASVDPIDAPLLVSSDDLAEIVEALARNRDVVNQATDTVPVDRTSYTEKNALNGMTIEFAREQRKRFLKDTFLIQTFLAAPENATLLALYESVVEDFQLRIIAKRKDHQAFDEVIVYLADVLFSRDAVLRQVGHRRLLRAMLFYMYWNCDIGLTKHDSPE